MAVLMTVELANMLIDHYEKAIKVVQTKSNFISARCVTDLRFVDYGLCYCAKELFRVDLLNCDFMRRVIPKGRCFIASPVYLAQSIDEMAELLQRRVDLLKQFISQNDGCINDSGIGE